MDGDALRERVETATETERSRLGSEKVLLAATNASLDGPAVAGVLVAAFERAAEQLEVWAEAVADDDLAVLLADGASTYADLGDAARSDWPEADPADDGLLADLGEPTTDPARAGAALLGVPVVLDRLLLQVVNFHVNEADETAADAARELRDEVSGLQVTAAERLASREDVDAIVDGATAAVEAAYATYAERLEGMGLDPKPIC
jgi:hypothetical protein